MTTKKITVLGRDNHAEAMRVAAGLTIYGHEVRIVFMSEAVAETEENAKQAELLELADIIPETTVPEMAEDLAFLDSAALAQLINDSDQIINI
jgi:sulfur relay (sulfurtransferase) DsrF/TusC family protein